MFCLHRAIAVNPREVVTHTIHENIPDDNEREKDEILSTFDDTVQNAIPVVVNKIIDARVDTAVKFSNLFHSTVVVTLQQRIG